MSTPPAFLGPYPVEREIGRGGMGVVYLARDPRLDRPVAIKVLPDLLALNPEALARFDREAKLLASLNHPNIATIYGVDESSEGAPGLQTRGRLLVLEYIPGDTLAARTARGPLPIGDTLDICRQIALAIEAAHEGGVIHRDLKPGNVKITPDGQVKVLDFGLAKGGAAVSDAELAHSPTMTFAATAMGVILGTAGYMSPEQARGKAVDRRTDIWSFGCVLFECLAGKQIFEGETVSDTIAKILEREPDWSALPANTPPRVRELLRRCLEKDLKKRQRDIGDVRIELEEAATARASSAHMPAAAAPESRRSMKTLALAAALVVVGAAAGVGLWNAMGPGARAAGSTRGGPIRLSIGVPTSIRATAAAITSDGGTFLLMGSARKADRTYEPHNQIFARRINEHEFKPLAGTDQATGFIVSSDGTSLAVIKPISQQSAQRQLVKVMIDGSAPPAKIANIESSWNAFEWLDNGDFLSVDTTGRNLIRLPKNGGTPGPAIPLDLGGGAAAVGSGLPGSQAVFLLVDTYNARGWSRDAWVLDLTSNKAHRVVENAGSIRYLPTGHVAFGRGDTLMAAAFDLKTLQITGEVTPLSRDLRIPASWGHGGFMFARDGTLLFAPGGLMGTDRRLVSIDAAGTVTPFTTERLGYETVPALSADGRRAAVVLANERGTYEIWIADKDRPIRRAITLPNTDCSVPIWSPSGKQLAYTRSALDKNDGVYIQDVDAPGPPRLVIGTGGPDTAITLNAQSWSRDGALLVSKNHGGKNQMLVVPVPAGSETATPRPLRTSAYSDWGARVSPDGRFVAFQSDESGKSEVYVATYSASAGMGAPVMASRSGGGGIGWTSDSHRLFFGSEDKLMSVTVDSKSGLSLSTPVASVDLKSLRVAAWDFFPDGRLLAIEATEEEEKITAFSIVLNWFDELKARMAKSPAK